MDQTRDMVSEDNAQRSAIALSRALQGERSSQHQTEEEALARFEAAARLLGVSGAGFLAKYKRGEFSPVESHPAAVAVADLIPPALIPR